MSFRQRTPNPPPAPAVPMVTLTNSHEYLLSTAFQEAITNQWELRWEIKPICHFGLLPDLLLLSQFPTLLVLALTKELNTLKHSSLLLKNWVPDCFLDTTLLCFRWFFYMAHHCGPPSSCLLVCKLIHNCSPILIVSFIEGKHACIVPHCIDSAW